MNNQPPLPDLVPGPIVPLSVKRPAEPIGPLPVPEIDPALQAKVNKQFEHSCAMSSEEEEAALDREIRLKSKHLDLDNLERGKYPERLVAEWSARGGFWKLAALVIDLIRRFM